MTNTAYKTFIKDITKHPLLSAEQEKVLSKKIQEGDTNAMQVLINANLRYVVSIAHKYAKNEDTLMDCIQEGSMGLMVAASKYDYRFNTRFCTYANPWITQYIMRHKKLIEPTIHIPALKVEKLRVLRGAHNTLEQLLGKAPSNLELSIYTGIAEDDIYELKKYDFTMCSLDAPIDSQNEKAIMHTLKDDSANPELDVMEQAERKDFMDVINKLPKRERMVIVHRYKSYINGDKTSYKEIGLKLGVSIEATRQIELRAKRKLQNLFETYYSEVYNEKIPV